MKLLPTLPEPDTTMAFLKRLSRHKASKPVKEVLPDCDTFLYHNNGPCLLLL